MPREYASNKKAAALVQLERNGGNVSLTAQQTGISERTFHTWQRSILPHLQRYPPPRHENSELPPFEDEMDMLAFIREQIMQELVQLSLDVRRTSHAISPHQRVALLSQLMDRLMKLDEHLKPYQPPPIFRITWETGLYVRSKEGYHGPFGPSDLPTRWKELFGEDASLEMYWGDSTMSAIPEGPVMDAVMKVVKLDFQTHLPLLTPDDQDIEWDEMPTLEQVGGGDIYAHLRYSPEDKDGDF